MIQEAIIRGEIYLGGNCPWEQFTGGQSSWGQLSGHHFGELHDNMTLHNLTYNITH